MEKLIALAGRVSSDRQKEEKTIEMQVSELKLAAEESKDAVVVDKYFDDGWSGSLRNRPELDRLRDDIKTDKWDEVWFTERDRLARNLAMQLVVVDEIESHGKKIVFLEDKGSNLNGLDAKVMANFKGVFAEYEKDKIAERFRRGRLAKARRGLPQGQAPYGYRYVRKSDEREGYVRIHEEEANNVITIFHWVADEGLSIRGIVKRLYEKKIMPQRSKRDTWSTSVISRMLRDEAYIGTIYWNKSDAIEPKTRRTKRKYMKYTKTGRKKRDRSEWIPISIEPIISQDLWQRAQDQLKDNVTTKKGNNKHHYLLRNHVYCACGRKRNGTGNNPNLYYRCTDRIYSFPLPSACKIPGVNVKVLDTKVWSKLFELLIDKSLITRHYERWRKSKHTASSTVLNGKIGQLNSQLITIKNKVVKYADAYAEGLINKDLYTDKAVALNKQIKALEQELRETDILIKTTDITKPTTDIAQDVRNLLANLDKSEKQVIVSKLIGKVVVNSQTSVTVEGFLPARVNTAKKFRQNNSKSYVKTRHCRPA